MADSSRSRTNRKRSSFVTKHFQRKSLNISTFIRCCMGKLLSFLAGIITCKVRCWVTETQTHRPSTVTLTAHAHWGLIQPQGHHACSKLLWVAVVTSKSILNYRCSSGYCCSRNWVPIFLLSCSKLAHCSRIILISLEDLGARLWHVSSLSSLETDFFQSQNLITKPDT